MPYVPVDEPVTAEEAESGDNAVTMFIASQRVTPLTPAEMATLFLSVTTEQDRERFLAIALAQAVTRLAT
jgi:hypothetical protein